MPLLIDFEKHWTSANDEPSDRGGVDDIEFLRDHIEFLDPCPSIVDLGCGIGNLVRHFRLQGKRAVGITYQAVEVEEGRRKLGLDLCLGDLHALPWDDSSFAGAVCWDALEHTLAPLIVLREIHRVLEPGGRALVFIPGQPWQDAPYHIIVPTIRQMAHLLGLAGFSHCEVTDYSWVTNRFGKQDEMAVYRLTK